MFLDVTAIKVIWLFLRTKVVWLSQLPKSFGCHSLHGFLVVTAVKVILM